jgi:hypothetical protein
MLPQLRIRNHWQLGESMVKYTKQVDKKITSLKRGNFSRKCKKIDSNLFKFHYETIEPSVGFIVNQLQNFKNIGIIKVGNKYV